MFFHVLYLAENYSSTSEVNAVARPTNTGSLIIIAIGCFQKLLEKHQKLRLWFKMGVETKKYIAISQRESNILVFVYFLSVS